MIFPKDFWTNEVRNLRLAGSAASTNTGHEAAPGVNMARFAFEKPEQLIDFAHRSHHETAVKAKAITEAFYAKPPQRSYLIGCSSGGYEGLMEAQRFPAAYDGIVAGMPANNWTRLMAGDFDATLATFKGGVNNLWPSALGLLHRAALSSCDSRNGVADGVLEGPRRCVFDPAMLSCKAGEQAEWCLTPAQVEAAQRVYGGLKDPMTGAQLYPGLAPGSESFWPNRDIANPLPIPVSHYRWLVFADPDWDWKSFDFGDPADYQAHLLPVTSWSAGRACTVLPPPRFALRQPKSQQHLHKPGDQFLERKHGEAQRQERQRDKDRHCNDRLFAKGEWSNVLNDGEAVRQVGERLNVAASHQGLIIGPLALHPLLLEPDDILAGQRTVSVQAVNALAKQPRGKHADRPQPDDVQKERHGHDLEPIIRQSRAFVKNAVRYKP